MALPICPLNYHLPNRLRDFLLRLKAVPRRSSVTLLLRLRLYSTHVQNESAALRRCLRLLCYIRLSLRFPGLCVRMGCEYLIESLFVFVSRRVKSLISDLYKFSCCTGGQSALDNTVILLTTEVLSSIVGGRKLEQRQ